jgi:hypothetical protein
MIDAIPSSMEMMRFLKIMAEISVTVAARASEAPL